MSDSPLPIFGPIGATGRALLAANQDLPTRPVEPQSFAFLDRTAVTMVDPKKILVGTNEARLFRSKDRGKTFEEMGRFFNAAYGPLESTKAFWIAGLQFASPSVGFMSTKGGGTYRTVDGGLSWTLEYSTELGWGAAVGDLAVADEEHAIAGGPNFLITRVPAP